MKSRVKRMMVLILSVVMVVAGMSVGAFAGQTSQTDSVLVVGSDFTSVCKGDTIDVTISLSENTTVNAFTGGIEFDNTALEYVSYKGNDTGNDDEDVYVQDTNGNYRQVGAEFNETSKNKFGLHFEYVEKDKTFTYLPCTLVTITFKALKTGNTTIYVYESSEGQRTADIDNQSAITLNVVTECPHNNKEFHAFKFASKTSDGNIAYYSCAYCGTCFSDATGSTIITKESTVIPKIVSSDVLSRLISTKGTDTPRIYGTDRIQTGLSVAASLKTALGVDKFNSAIVANAWNYPDALAGGYLSACRGNAPILLTDSSNNTSIANYIKNNVVAGSTVYILGNSAAVSTTLDSLLKNAGFTVERLQGNDRMLTNIEILKETDLSGGGDLIVCNAWNYADSLPASALGKPILLVEGNTLTTAQANYLSGMKFDNIYILGSTSAVSSSIASVMRSYTTSGTSSSVIRLYGASRVETAKAVADYFYGSDTEAVALAYAWEYPDGLSGGPLAQAVGAPILLTSNGSSEATVAKNFVTSNGIGKGVALGGSLRISDSTFNTIMGK